MTKECLNDEGQAIVACFVNDSSFVIRASSFAARLPISSRLELRRAFSFSHGTSHRDVIQFATIDGATQQQTAPAHVAAPHEISRETETLSEMREEHVHVFGGGDAAEENDLTVGG